MAIGLVLLKMTLPGYTEGKLTEKLSFKILIFFIVLKLLWVETTWNQHVHIMEQKHGTKTPRVLGSEGASEWASLQAIDHSSVQRSGRVKRAKPVGSKWMSERCKQRNERTNEWPSTIPVYSSIIRLTVCGLPSWYRGVNVRWKKIQHHIGHFLVLVE